MRDSTLLLTTSSVPTFFVSSCIFQVVIRLSDTGAGIPPEILGKMSEPFVTHGKSHGTGLGMAMAKSVVTAHHGTIAVTRVPGNGTTAEIRLPAPAA